MKKKNLPENISFMANRWMIINKILTTYKFKQIEKSML